MPSSLRVSPWVCAAGLWAGGEVGLALRSCVSQGGRHVADAPHMLWAEDWAGELGVGFLGAGRFCRPAPSSWRGGGLVGKGTRRLQASGQRRRLGGRLPPEAGLRAGHTEPGALLGAWMPGGVWVQVGALSDLAPGHGTFGRDQVRGAHSSGSQGESLHP